MTKRVIPQGARLEVRDDALIFFDNGNNPITSLRAQEIGKYSSVKAAYGAIHEANLAGQLTVAKRLHFDALLKARTSYASPYQDDPAIQKAMATYRFGEKLLGKKNNYGPQKSLKGGTGDEDGLAAVLALV